MVQTHDDCMNILKRGIKNRATRQIKMNEKSSRSHCIFQILIESKKVDENGMIKRSKLNLGDLAGSEKIDKNEGI